MTGSLPRMRIGILGATGPAGSGLAARLASVGHEVLYGSRAVDKASSVVDELEKEWGDRVAGSLHPCDNAWACDAPVVILAVNADSAIPTVHEHAERLQGKIVVSMANNLVKHGNEFNAVLPPHGSVAAEIQALLWRSHVCTAFHLVPAAEFADVDHEMESDVVVLGDQDDAKTTLMEITSSIPNLRPLDGGSLRNAVGMETFAAVLLTVNIRHKMRASLRLTLGVSRRTLRSRDRVVIVTGASRGIGKGLALGLAGSARRSCARRARSSRAGAGCRARSTTRSTRSSRGRHRVAVRCDIGDERDITHLVDDDRRRFGRLDVLVNNAMAPTRALVRRVDRRASGTSRCASTCAASTCSRRRSCRTWRGGRRQHREHLVARRRPRDRPFMPPGYLIYSVAKAALERFTSAAAPELRPLGITINALRPGAVKTEMTDARVRRRLRLDGLGDARLGRAARSRPSSSQIDTDFTGRVARRRRASAPPGRRG